MRNYINIIYISGCCGNFFSRCLNLLDNYYCYVDPLMSKKNIVEQNKEEKYNFLSYTTILEKIRQNPSANLGHGWWHDQQEYHKRICKFYNIVDSAVSCVNEVQKIAYVVGTEFTDLDSYYITQLYDQWIKTVITRDKFEVFKERNNLKSDTMLKYMKNFTSVVNCS